MASSYLTVPALFQGIQVAASTNSGDWKIKRAAIINSLVHSEIFDTNVFSLILEYDPKGTQTLIQHVPKKCLDFNKLQTSLDKLFQNALICMQNPDNWRFYICNRPYYGYHVTTVNEIISLPRLNKSNHLLTPRVLDNTLSHALRFGYPKIARSFLEYMNPINKFTKYLYLALASSSLEQPKILNELIDFAAKRQILKVTMLTLDTYFITHFSAYKLGFKKFVHLLIQPSRFTPKELEFLKRFLPHLIGHDLVLAVKKAVSRW